MTKKTPWRGHSRPGQRRFPPKTRKLILKRDPICVLALPGCTETATEADHITGWGPAQAMGWTKTEYDHPSNGQGVCSNCHRAKTLKQATQGRRMAQQNREKASTEAHPGILETPE